MTYTKKFLILELQRFHMKRNRVPRYNDMTLKNGYPSGEAYRRHFGTWNDALKLAKLKINKIHPKFKDGDS